MSSAKKRKKTADIEMAEGQGCTVSSKCSSRIVDRDETNLHRRSILLRDMANLVLRSLERGDG